MFDLTGKKALVTGSTQGIGFAVAKTLAEHGAIVYLHGAATQEKCEKAASQIPNAIAVVQDFTDPEGADKLYQKTGDVDIVIANASVQFRMPWDQITAEQFDTQVLVNLKTTLRLFQLYTPYMKAQNRGRLITVGSVQQYKPHKDMAIYAATKAAQMNLVQNLAKQLAPFGITVNNIAPGVIATPRNEAALSDTEYAKQVLAGIPAGYAGEPQDLAGAALLLSSDAGRYITGIDLIVDGGMKL